MIQLRAMKDKSFYDYVASGLNKAEDLNCAETMLHAANRAYGLGLSPESLKLAAGFGGGMGFEGLCGVLTGGSMVLSAMFVQQRGHESELIKQLNREFVDAFRARMNSVDCAPLKDLWRKDDVGCLPVILEGAELLQSIIDRELAIGRG